MSTYNSFAPYYDRVMGDRSNEAARLHTLIQRHAPKAKSLLELGCGSGSLIDILRRSYSCCGIDLSKEMIRVAKRKLPKIPFTTGDITKFHLDRKFDAVICAFDTINHVTSFQRWCDIFRRAHAHLNSGGVFIFDINTRYKLERIASEAAFAEISTDMISIVDGVKSSPSRYQLEVRALVRRGKSNTYALHTIKVPEVTFSVPRIKAALSKHFEHVVTKDFDRSRPGNRTEELYFVCKKPR